MQVIVSGTGCVTCAGLSPRELFDAACRGQHGLRHDATSGLTLGLLPDSAINNLRVPKGYEYLLDTPRARPYALLYDSLRQAMDTAGWDHIPAGTGLIFATTTGFVPYWEDDLVAFVNDGLSAADFRKSFRDHPLSRPLEPLFHAEGWNGPVRIITSACAAGTQALVVAREWIVAGTVARCIVAGTELLSKLTVRGFNSLNLISKNPCAPFDKNRDGINLSEGSGVILLERDDLAINRLAVLSGGGTSLDSFDMTSPDPTGDGIARAVKAALDKSRLSPSDIDWIHAHGTGSQVNDVAEAAAALRIFGHDAPPLTSTKGLHGHALAASGIVESVLCIEAMRNQTMLGTTGHKETDEKVGVPILTENKPATIRHVLKTTLGFGGVNAAVILSAAEAPERAPAFSRKDTGVYIAAAAWAKRAESEPLLRDPAFRKATTPMAMAWQAVAKALAQLPDQNQQEQRRTWGLVFGTSHGELDVTKEFLVTLANKGLARPILFQNSLHHSTLGFISLRLGICGPGLTVSRHFFSGEDAVASAREMIQNGDCEVVLTVAVDAMVESLDEALGQYYPHGRLVDEGAGCLILASEAGLRSLGLSRPLARLKDLDFSYEKTERASQQDSMRADYDSDAIEKIARYLSESTPISGDRAGEAILQLNKPDGRHARIAFASAE